MIAIKKPSSSFSSKEHSYLIDKIMEPVMFLRVCFKINTLRRSELRPVASDLSNSFKMLAIRTTDAGHVPELAVMCKEL